MKNLVSELIEKYDYVFIDSPPICRLNDAFIIAQYVDGTVLVNASKEIDPKVAKLTLEKLKKVGANIIGVVLNKFRSEQYNYYSYYSYYGYDDNRKGIFRRKKQKMKHR